MTTVYVLAALIIVAAAIFFIPIINPVRVIPRRPEPNPGGISWKVDFRLWFPAWRGGYIVQHVTIRERVTDCNDPKFAAPYIDRRVEFWEAWPVKPGRTRQESPPPPAPAPAPDSDDIFGFGIPEDDLGMQNQGRVLIEVRAELRFFPGVTLPATFIRSNPATQAGWALSDSVAPPFWRPGGVRHDLTAEWENCGGDAIRRWKRVDEVPKFRE